jgi:hypothetical protein
MSQPPLPAIAIPRILAQSLLLLLAALLGLLVIASQGVS